MAHIFISYSHDDSEYALWLAEALEKEGFTPWIDERIDYGSQWPRVIQENLEKCSAFIVIMTPRSFASNWVQNELSYAQGEGKPIFPLLLKGKAWLSVAATQYVDVRDGSLPPPRFYKRVSRLATQRNVLTITSPLHLELIRIPAGEFLMGSDPKKDKDAKESEQPQHSVYLSEFFIGKYPVTNEQYRAFVDSTERRVPKHWEGGKIPKGEEDHPVVNVYWSDARYFCDWLEAETWSEFRLPTEAEWEKAARGTDGRIYPWGDELDTARCNNADSEGELGATMPVGQCSPQRDSPYGCADMAGNVWEWCADWEGPSEYKERAGKNVTDPQGPAIGDFRVLRGGSWHHLSEPARAAYRWGFDPQTRLSYSGFRVCVSRPPSP